MGQKSNPISLRLEKTNQHWSNCWYSDHSYATQFLQDCRINAYFQNCSQQLKKTPPVLSLKHQRGQMQIALFSLHPAQQQHPTAGRRSARNRTVGSTAARYAREKKTKVEKLNAFFSIAATIETNSPALLHTERQDNDKINDSVWKGLRGFLFASQLGIMNADQPLPVAQKSGTSDQGAAHSRQAPLTTRFESSIVAAVNTSRAGGNTQMSTYRTYRCNIHLFKIPSPYQSAAFIASRVVFLLQERVPFRQLKLRLIPELEIGNAVKGMRITCSGRVASRSKKAQKASTDSIQWGETGLNIFSELVHFASKSAQTTHGKLGVKVWVCYSEEYV